MRFRAGGSRQGKRAAVGSNVDLVIDPYQSHDLQDTFRFTAIIER